MQGDELAKHALQHAQGAFRAEVRGSIAMVGPDKYSYTKFWDNKKVSKTAAELKIAYDSLTYRGNPQMEQDDGGAESAGDGAASAGGAAASAGGAAGAPPLPAAEGSGASGGSPAGVCSCGASSAASSPPFPA